jgi:hypothetical protein
MRKYDYVFGTTFPDLTMCNTDAKYVSKIVIFLTEYNTSLYKCDLFMIFINNSKPSSDILGVSNFIFDAHVPVLRTT